MAQKRKAIDTRPLATYRPGIDRWIFGLALLGVVVAMHLWIQQSRGFAGGCTGFEPGAGASVFDCGAVISSAAGTFIGVSNTVWGLLFYLAATFLTALAAVGPVRWLRPAKQARLGLVSFGLLYSAYLILYQFTQLDAWCLLCLISAAIVTVLTVLVWMDYRKPVEPVYASAKQRSKREADAVSNV